MANAVYLYNARDAGSIALRDALIAAFPMWRKSLWTDLHTSDAGFDDGLIEQLRACDAVIVALGEGGAGRYQERNELGRVADALRANPNRRLVAVMLPGASRPASFAVFDAFPGRIGEVGIDQPTDIAPVLRCAFPNAPPPQPGEAAEDKLAGRLAGKVREGRNLVLVIGPYAFAEAATGQTSPARVIRSFLRSRKLGGYAPWYDTIGSIARATSDDPVAAARAIVDALSNTMGGGGGLDVYLRLLAANCAKRAGGGRLFIVSAGPDKAVDNALEASGLEVPHLRLVHTCGERGGLFAERLNLTGAGIERQQLPDAGNQSDPRDRVVLIKPFGCIDLAGKAMLTAEQWREGREQMPLPIGLADEVSRSVLLVLGAGVFAPTMQLLFGTLVCDALADREGNVNRYLIHDPTIKVPDPLHRVEAALARSDDDEVRENFTRWLMDTYKLTLRRMNSVTLLGWLDHHVNR